MPENRTQAGLVKSTGHAFAACLFDLFGDCEISLDSEGDFIRRAVAIEGCPPIYLTALRKLYGGKVRQGAWVCEDDEAEAFAKATYHFAPCMGRALEIFVLACMANRKESTPHTIRRRRKLVEMIEKDETKFTMPGSFFPRSRPQRIHPFTRSFEKRLSAIKI
jgi:hypothetical protein